MKIKDEVNRLRKAHPLFRVSVVDYEVRMEMRKKYGK